MEAGTKINRNNIKNDNWATPSYFYDELNKEFNFDFDPCPFTENEITPETDGLLKGWGERNFINPPYTIKPKTAFILKAIEESKKGKLCVMLLPVMGTSTKLFHDIILPNISEPIRFIKGRIKFVGKNTKGELVSNKSPMHDSMIVIFGGQIKNIDTDNFKEINKLNLVTKNLEDRLILRFEENEQHKKTIEKYVDIALDNAHEISDLKNDIIKFAEWCADNKWSYGYQNNWMYEGQFITTEKLYIEFKNQKK